MFRLSLVLVLGLALGGCAQKVTNFDRDSSLELDTKKSCAILPFVNSTNNLAASEAVTSFFTTEVKKKNLCKVIEKSESENRLKSIGIDKEKLYDSKYAQEIGKKLGVDYVFSGSVSEYNYQYGLREDPAVGISARLIDVGSGEVLWMGDEGRVGRSVIFRDSLDGTAIDTVISLLGTLK